MTKNFFASQRPSLLWAWQRPRPIADTLDDVKAKGFVQCGVTDGTAGFAAPDANNNWAGLDVDYCRAIAAAIFNDPTGRPLHAADSTGALHRAVRPAKSTCCRAPRPGR